MDRRAIIQTSEEEIQRAMKAILEKEAEEARQKIIMEEARNRIRGQHAQEAAAARKARETALAEAEAARKAAEAAQKIAKEREEAARKAAEEAERKKLWQNARDAQRAASLPNWILNGCYYNKLEFPERLPEGWGPLEKADLERAFWEYVVSKGGFDKCPTCSKKPSVNRRCTWSNSLSGRAEVQYCEGLFNSIEHPNRGAITNKIESINCCQHLFDFTGLHRYVTASSMTAPPATDKCIGFRVQESYRHWSSRHLEQFGYQQDEQYCRDGYSTRCDKLPRPLYVKYNPEDPDGSIAVRKEEEVTRQAQIAHLEPQLAALRTSESESSIDLCNPRCSKCLMYTMTSNPIRCMYCGEKLIHLRTTKPVNITTTTSSDSINDIRKASANNNGNLIATPLVYGGSGNLLVAPSTYKPGGRNGLL